jgi:prephenate dehydratase
MRLAYLGPPGTFGEQAAIAFASPGDELIECPSHSAVARAVEGGRADAGVMAMENSIQGSVTETLDALIHETRQLTIQAELMLPIEHHLVAREGLLVTDIRVLYAHPQAYAQSRRYVEKHMPTAVIEAALSNAASVEMALARGADAAAIGTARAAELLGASFLAHGIQDRDDNLTRFILVGRDHVPPTGHDRTSIAFWFAEDRPGSVAGVLTAFAVRRINCTRIESRPTRGRFGEYLFLIDFEGHSDEEPGKSALADIRGLCSQVRVFGSYPRAD